MSHEALRHEIAAAAAQAIADGGLDYQSAKRKAARQLLGDAGGGRAMPDNELVDQYLREHLDLFDPQHAARVERWRSVAARWMQRLDAFAPYVTGAAWKGVVAEHAPVHLQVFTEQAKELEMRLLDDGVRYDVDEIDHFAGRGRVPVLQFEDADVPVMVSVYGSDDLRGALHTGGRHESRDGAQRGDLAALRARLDGAGPPPATDGDDRR